jgi:hypothetical protein
MFLSPTPVLNSCIHLPRNPHTMVYCKDIIVFFFKLVRLSFVEPKIRDQINSHQITIKHFACKLLAARRARSYNHASKQAH